MWDSSRKGAVVGLVWPFVLYEIFIKILRKIMKSFQPSSTPKELLGDTKKCSECLADIPKEAKKCSHCSSKQKQPSSFGKLLLILCIVGIATAAIISAGATNTSSSVSNDSVITENKAKIMAENYVETVLKSPSTADFPLSPTNFIEITSNQYKVISYVDSQNSFGATVRSDWSATLTFNGGDWSNQSNWTLNELIFDGELVYSE